MTRKSVEDEALVVESETYVKAVADAIAGLAGAGFPAQFDLDEHCVLCLSCRSRCNAADVAWMQHVEVTCSEGTRTAVVCGLRCPVCGSRGTATATVEQWEQRRTGRSR